MFEEAIHESNIIGFIEEETADDQLSHKVLFRVLDSKRWAKVMVMLFRDVQEEEAFGLSIRKEFYWDDEDHALTFCWVLLVWGDIEDACDTLRPHLVKRAGPPKPPPSMTATLAAPRGLHQVIVKRSAEVADDGSTRQRTVVALPHRSSPQRNKKLGKTKKMGDKGRGAYVESISGDGGDPRDL